MTAWRETRSRSYRCHAVLPNLFTRDECHEIISLCEAHPTVPGKTRQGEAYEVNGAIRDVETAYISRCVELAWVYDRMDQESFRLAAEWGLEVRETVESLKYLVYEPRSHFNTWDLDVGDDYSNLRKISMSVELTDSSDYAGGELQLFPVDRGHVAGPVRRPEPRSPFHLTDITA